MVIGYGPQSNSLAEHDNYEVKMSGAGTLRDPRHPSAMSGEALGHVHSVNGSRVSVGLLKAGPGSLHGAGITVGKFVKIQIAKALLVGVITDVSLQTTQHAKEQGCIGTAHVDLMGEVDARGPALKFRRGVTDYPTIGDPVEPLTSAEMRAIFDSPGPRSIQIGHLQQDTSIAVSVDVDEVLSKHFAVLGTTGVGKSSAVALLLQQVLRARPELRIMLLDVHNEYARCFGDRAYVVSPTNLRLPFWLFSFEEIVDVFFGGRPVVEDEVAILSDIIPLAKVAYTQYRATVDRLAVKKLDPKSIGYTADTPVPYRLQDLLMMIDERMGKLENRSSRMIYHRLITRIETVSNDSRYAFLFENANVGGDTMAEVVGALFRLPADGKPVTVVQLAGIPAEVVDSVVAVVCRMAFDFGLWSDGAIPLLFVCEEAHRYAAADRNIGFGPTRKAVSRIAKEGRKYGVYLGLVTQRPAELDATIISQCNTLFTMRLANDRDQALLRSAVSDAAANLLSFVPSLGTREVLAFGEGVALPTRLRFKEVPTHQMPRSESTIATVPSVTTGHDTHFVSAVLERWRGATSQRDVPGDQGGLNDRVPTRTVESPMLQPSQGFDPDRFSVLKKPLR